MQRGQRSLNLYVGSRIARGLARPIRETILREQTTGAIGEVLIASVGFEGLLEIVFEGDVTRLPVAQRASLAFAILDRTPVGVEHVPAFEAGELGQYGRPFDLRDFRFDGINSLAQPAGMGRTVPLYGGLEETGRTPRSLKYCWR